MLIKWDLSKILSKIFAPKALIVRAESKISKIFELISYIGVHFGSMKPPSASFEASKGIV